MKRCSKCKLSKPLGDFHRNRRQEDGLQVWCKTCLKAHQNQRRQENREEYREYQRRWFADHPDYYRKYTRKPKTAPRPVVVFDDD